MAIISGMVGIIVFGGFVDYTFWGLRELTIKTQLGHIQLYKKGYNEKGIAEPSKYLINNADNVQRIISKLPGLKIATNRLTFSGLISNGEKTLSCKVVGIEPEKEIDMAAFETIVQGSQLDSSVKDGGVIGVELMNGLGAHVGDSVTIMTTTLDGMINAVEFKIIGVAQTGSQDYDSVFVKLPLRMAQQVLGTSSVEKIIVFLNDTDSLKEATPVLNKLILKNHLNIEYKRWDELALFYNKVVKVYEGIFRVINIIIGAVILFSITNTMSMSIFERVREIGTLRAIGTTKRGILLLFLLEGLLIGITGGLLGIIAGVATAWAINLSGGIYIPPPPGMSRGYIAFILTPVNSLIVYFMFMVVVATVSSIFPAYRASRLKVVDALGHI
jgi:putative ABC transport system permease protein